MNFEKAVMADVRVKIIQRINKRIELSMLSYSRERVFSYGGNISGINVMLSNSCMTLQRVT